MAQAPNAKRPLTNSEGALKISVFFMADWFDLLVGADRIEATFGFACATVRTIVIHFVVVFSGWVENGLGGTGAYACATELTFFRIDLMHFFSPLNRDITRMHFRVENLYGRPVGCQRNCAQFAFFE